MNGADTAASRGLASCHVCCKLVPATEHECPRCGAAVHLRGTDSLQRTVALLITASILFIPANLYPIMITSALGTEDISTILGGVVLLVKLGSIPIALVMGRARVCVAPERTSFAVSVGWPTPRHRGSSAPSTREFVRVVPPEAAR